MSYHNSYIVIDKEKLQIPENLSDTSEDEQFDLINQCVDHATVHSYSPEDEWVIVEVCKLHNLQYTNYISAKQFTELLSSLDSAKIQSLLPNHKAQLTEELDQINSFVDVVKDGLKNNIFDEGPVNIEQWQTYSVPLCEAHGIIIYNLLDKVAAEKLITSLNDKDINTAVVKIANIDSQEHETKRAIVTTLKELREIHNLLQSNPNFALLYYDDHEQEHFPKEMLLP